MKDKIVKEVLDWCEKQEQKPDLYLEDFVDVVIDKAANTIFEEIKNELKNEFENGNLKHPFVISDEYYIYLKLKEIKGKLIKQPADQDFIEKEEQINKTDEEKKLE